MSIFDEIDSSHATVSSELRAQKELNANILALQSAITSMNANVQSMITNIQTVNSSINTLTVNPIYRTSTATKTSVASFAAATSVLLCAANANRKGITIYNNSTNSLYICIQNPAVAADLIDFVATNAGPTSVVKWLGPLVYTGALYGIRNAGTGGVTVWEFT